MNILLVKTSSMGDVVHAAAVVADIRKHFPQAQIDWLVEESFADIPQRVQGVRAVIPCAVRRWRKQVMKPEVWQEIKALKSVLRAHKYDLVIDLQGLIKSGVLASWAQAPVCGYDAQSIKEPLARFFYRKRFSVSKALSAVERCRALTADSLGYERPKEEAQFIFSPEIDAAALASSGTRKTVFFFCNTSRDTKLWPESKWIEFGKRLSRKGFDLILPWGSPKERERAQKIAKEIGGKASVPERMSIGKLMDRMSAEACAVVGLDTGMTHLSSAMGIPTVGIFRDYPIELVPLVGNGKKKALGGVDACPEVAEVCEAFEEVMQ